MLRLLALAAVLAPSGTLAAQAAPAPATSAVGQRARIDGERMLADLATLAHDSMQGRRVGTPGGERARRFLVQAFEERGLQTVGGARTHAFTFQDRRGGGPVEGVNVLGMLPGSEHPDRWIVVTAHYDHLGVQGAEIFNGADDNASGTAALLALAGWLRQNLPRHSVLFVAFDAEESGLQGARAFIRDPPVPLERIVLNVNLDMVSRSEAGELYAAGTYHYPLLTPLVDRAAEASGIRLLKGHDRPGLPPGDDWTTLSDHGAFHEAGIPFLYFGVEDHAGYHTPADIFEDITPAFYAEAIETVLDFLLLADEAGEEILEGRGR